MQIFKNHRARKELKDILHHAKHVRHMHEDIADPELIEQLRAAEKTARDAYRSGEGSAMETAGRAIEPLCAKVAPSRPHPKIRENVEVLFVAIAAAMAIRAYFFQPFKIPTGSMQPTLYGITVRPLEQGEATALPVRIVKFFWKGEVFLANDTLFDRLAKMITVGSQYNVRAKTTGYIRTHNTAAGVVLDYRDNFDAGQTRTIFIGNVPHNIPRQLTGLCRFGEEIRAGEPILRGVAKAGDYILVNRMKYNFVHPKRGDIVVFDAAEATGKAAYYIKRLVGLPNETISIDPPYLLVNGEKPTDHRFDKLFHNNEYRGYVFGSRYSDTVPFFEKPGDSITLAKNQFLFFGDNTVNSLDGRYFGPVKQKCLLGSAFFVGLPLDRAGFAETVH